MEKHFAYTTLAQRYTARFPLLTYVGTQANLWILANLLLAAVLRLHARILGQALHQPVPRGLGAPLLTAVGVGVVWGGPGVDGLLPGPEGFSEIIPQRGDSCPMYVKKNAR